MTPRHQRKVGTHSLGTPHNEKIGGTDNKDKRKHVHSPPILSLTFVKTGRLHRLRLLSFVLSLLTITSTIGVLFSWRWRGSTSAIATIFDRQTAIGAAASPSSPAFVSSRASPPPPSSSSVCASLLGRRLHDKNKSFRMSSSSSPPQSFASFLSQCQTNVTNYFNNAQTIPKTLHMTLGNEAGDADSIVSSLALSYIQCCLLSPAPPSHIQPLPVVSVPRSDISLRRDSTVLLETLCGIPLQHWICIDDQPLPNLLLSPQNPSLLHLTLLDHNQLAIPFQPHLSSNVVEIIDHHEDLGRYTSTVPTHRRQIAFQDRNPLVASTCTLVTERLMNSQSKTLDPALGLALLGTILLDTVNMNPQAAKGTPRDDGAIDWLIQCTDWDQWNNILDQKQHQPDQRTTALQSIFQQSPHEHMSKWLPNRTALFTFLANAKSDPLYWSSLSAKDCFRLDYKSFPLLHKSTMTLGLSSVLLPLSQLLTKQDFLSSLLDQFNDPHLSLFGAMGFTMLNGNPQREMIIFQRTTTNTDLLPFVATFLLEHDSASFLDLTLQEVTNDLVVQELQQHGIVLRRFQQGNVRGSRKQMAPVLLDAMMAYNKDEATAQD